MSEPLSAQQQLALWKWLTETLASQRTKVMLPAAGREMPPGARMPAMFGGRRAAWVNMPQPTRKAPYVSDPAKLLAWAKETYPAKVGDSVTIPVTDELVGFLSEHMPSALVVTERPDPQWVADICAALKDAGCYATADGEKLTQVPGITVPEPGTPVPSVTLADDAAAVIGAAWRAGDIPVADLLALPSGEGS